MKVGDLLATRRGISSLSLAPDPIFHKFFDACEAALYEDEVCLVIGVTKASAPGHDAYYVVLSNGVIGWVRGAYVRQVGT